MTSEDRLGLDSAMESGERTLTAPSIKDIDEGTFGSKFLGRIALGRPRLWPLLILVAWLPLLVYLSLLSRTPRVPIIANSLASPLAHIATSAVLTALVYWTLSARADDRRGRIRSALISAGVAAMVGLVLELVQSRYSSVRLFESSDLLASVLGAALSAMVLVTLTDLGFSRRMISGGTAGMVLLMTGGVLASTIIWNPAYPYRGDHWHAQYLVSVCGELAPAFSAFPGGIHTHQSRVLHIHPGTADEEGAKANLGLFFQRAGGELSDGVLELPTGERYVDGDACGGGSVGELKVWDYDTSTRQRVARIKDPAKYVPSNFQSILIEFGTKFAFN